MNTSDILVIINLIISTISPLILSFAYTIRKIKHSDCKNCLSSNIDVNQT